MTPLVDISEHLPTKEGFCRPDWEAISRSIESNVPESEWNTAWENASRQWVDRLRGQLEGDYRVYETPNFLILTEASERVARDACDSYEALLKQILLNLRGVASDERYGKHVVLMFGSLDDYYRYIAYFYPEGEHPMSGGVCLSSEGYVHFAFLTADYSSYRTTLVHELTHGCLAHLSLPAWLNEALAMRMEQVVCGSHAFALNRELYARHVAHWNDDSIQDFWAGESWQIPGDSFELSYNLAQILWRKIEVDIGASPQAIRDFIATANASDGGEAACQSIFDLSLADLVSDFLGEGEWKPNPSTWSKPRSGASAGGSRPTSDKRGTR